MSKHTPRTVTGIVTQLHEGIDAVHKAEIARLKAQNAELLADLEYIANMNEYDQDDAHRLRHLAKCAIAKHKEQSK